MEIRSAGYRPEDRERGWVTEEGAGVRSEPILEGDVAPRHVGERVHGLEGELVEGVEVEVNRKPSACHMEAEDGSPGDGVVLETRVRALAEGVAVQEHRVSCRPNSRHDREIDAELFRHTFDRIEHDAGARRIRSGDETLLHSPAEAPLETRSRFRHEVAEPSLSSDREIRAKAATILPGRPQLALVGVVEVEQRLRLELVVPAERLVSVDPVVDLNLEFLGKRVRPEDANVDLEYLANPPDAFNDKIEGYGLI